jgi:DNA relaxase NicK
MELKPIACVDSGVDYLTCSYNADVDFARLGLFVNRVKRVEQREGNIVRSWGMSGYQGERVGGLEWGSRKDGSIVRLSGFSAQRWWRRFGSLATNCSRIDLQQTFLHEEGWSKIMKEIWRQMHLHWKNNQHRPKPRVFVGPFGPETVYSGERTSDVYLRAYHRGSKKGLGHLEGHVRFEAELKDTRAWLTLQRLLSAKEHHADVRSQCWTMFENRGCRLVWSNAETTRIRAPSKESDVHKRLAWLEKAVQPCVLELIHLGYGDEVLRALGLIDSVPVE